eukprot:scaffold117045_cov32-Tisochrysis_lutea.AAC.3
MARTSDNNTSRSTPRRDAAMLDSELSRSIASSSWSCEPSVPRAIARSMRNTWARASISMRSVRSAWGLASMRRRSGCPPFDLIPNGGVNGAKAALPAGSSWLRLLCHHALRNLPRTGTWISWSTDSRARVSEAWSAASMEDVRAPVRSPARDSPTNNGRALCCQGSEVAEPVNVLANAMCRAYPASNDTGTATGRHQEK